MQKYRQCIYYFINYHFKTELTYLGSFQISEKNKTILDSVYYVKSHTYMIQNSIIHYTNFSFLRLIYYINLLPKLDFAHFEFDLLYTVHFKMHFFIEQYLSIILKLLKIVARMIL